MREPGGAGGPGSDPDAPEEDAGRPGREAGESELGPRGWLLVAAVFVAFLVVPTVIYLRPPALPFTVTYLVLPLVPAVLLALLAVWTVVRP